MSIKNIIEKQDTKAGIVFDLIIQSLILLSLIAFTIETLPNLNDRYVLIFKNFEIITIIIFSLEYIFRLFVTDKKLKYIFSFYGLIDLVAILPYYLFIGIDLRSIRIFRLLRIFRVLKLFRLSDSIETISKAFKNVKSELILFMLLTLMLIYVSSVGIYFFEKDAQPEQFKSIFHCMWWAISTLTTVGYGDVYPITTGGKIFTAFITIIGVGIVAIPTGLFASSLTKITKKD